MKLNLVGFVIVCAIAGGIKGNETRQAWTESINISNFSVTRNQSNGLDKSTNPKDWEDEVIKGMSECTRIKQKNERISNIIIVPESGKLYPKNCYMRWEEKVEEGYGIEVNIEYYSLGGDEGDLLYIRGGSAKEPNGKGPILSWMLKNPLKLIIHHTNKIFILFVSKQTKDQLNYGFKLTYQRYGELTTTAVPTTTTPDLPTAKPGIVRPDILVNLTKITPPEFNSKLSNFTTSLATFTKKFCDDNNIVTLKNITEDNIVIKLISYCPRYWPDRDNCVQVRFSIPIEVDNGNTSNKAQPVYELSAKSLEKLWSRYSKTELKKLGAEIYETPNDTYYLSLWMGVTLGTLTIVLIAFLAILFWIWKTSNAKDYSNIGSKSSSLQSTYRSPGEMDLGLDPDAKRPSTFSLYAEPHQLVPELFESMEPRYHDNDGFVAEQRPNAQPRMNIPSKASAEIPEDFLQKIKQGPIYLSGGIKDESLI